MDQKIRTFEKENDAMVQKLAEVILANKELEMVCEEKEMKLRKFEQIKEALMNENNEINKIFPVGKFLYVYFKRSLEFVGVIQICSP